MAMVHVISLKIGASHGVWQFKVSGTHERIMLPGMRTILDGTCRLLGGGCSDRSVVYLFSFCSAPFEGWLICLEKLHEAREGCHYRVAQSNIGRLPARGLLPAFLRESYLREWPARLYFALERSLTGAIVN